MVRKTKSIPQALERIAPFTEAVGWDIECLGGGKWHAIHWPTEKYFGGPHLYRAQQMFVRLVWHIAEAHPDPEAVKHAVRWYGDIGKIQRAQKTHYTYIKALRWFNVDERYDVYARPVKAKQVYNNTEGEIRV